MTPLTLLSDPQTPTGKSIDVAALQDSLREEVSGEVRFDRIGRALYSTDASVHQIVPLGVVVPKTEEDIIAIVKICGRFGVPITPRGGGTSQAGQAVGPGIQIDFSKSFNRILEFKPDERWARVEPGCVLDDLNQEAQRYGLQFPHDISTSNRATIGGMIANNSSGARSVIYGKTIDHVLELKVVLANGSVIQARPLDGRELETKCRQQDQEGDCYRVVRRLAHEHADEIDRRYPKILRRVGGYNLDRFVSGTRPFNLAELLVGSEGTLGITLETKLRLVELPKAKALLVVQFVDLLKALEATPAILAHQPSAVEVLDKYILDSTRLNAEAARLRDFLTGDPAAILIIEFSGNSPEQLPARLDQLEADLRKRNFGYHYHRATEATAQARIWKLRKAALGLSMAEKGDAKAISFVEDSAVAPQRLRDYISELLALINRHGTKAGVYAHASVGCLHVRPVINLKTEEGVQQFAAIAEGSAELVLKYGGAISGEHGDGLVRSPFQEKMYGPVIYNAFRQIKRVFDPQNLFNPGKIVDAPPLTANLRFGPAYVTPEVPTTFDFAAEGGLARAAELCSGVGECRKKQGTMCPSYQATRDEEHSTRGRANILRLAITGQLGFQGFTDPAVKEVLDLCLECKACKSECPTNVDMARLKAEFLDQYHKKHGLPWRNWVFGHLEHLSFWGTLTAPLSSWLIRSWPARWLTEKMLHIDRHRLAPRFAFRNLGSRLYESKWMDPPVDGFYHVRFFLDTFANQYEPELGMSTLQLFNRLGLHVGIGGAGYPDNSEPGKSPRKRCCGRPLLSNGLLDQAVENALENVRLLYPFAARGERIIACEPSCILTIKDDYPALLRGEDRQKAETVATACQTFEEFLETAISNPPQSRDREGAVSLPLPHSRGSEGLRFRAGPKKILVHGHCHQRSLVGMEPTLRLLRRIPGAEVIDLDAGCCGMAGSFGYEKEHYEISRLIGEQRLFPAVRNADEHTVIVASGFSCRQQIQHFTGRTALHPAQLLRSLLVEPSPL